MEWRYGKAMKGMYINSHKHGDVVKYQKGFLACMKEYSTLMTIYDQDGNVLTHPTGVDLAAGILPVTPVTHQPCASMSDPMLTPMTHQLCTSTSDPMWV